ncbi:MAG: lipopolysaccharide biosynthesis protein [Rhodopirellula sp.]|nr:lipopolysaccharide biosynthesis protein [Rhodopirellula sp.]
MSLCELTVTDESLPPPRDALRTDTLAESVLILLILTVVQRLVGFVRAVLFCRWLDAEQLGQWDLAFGFLVLAAPLIVLAVPGAFGRYVEHYRQQGQLRSFLRRTLAVCGGLGLASAAAVYLMRRWFAALIFGSDDHAEMVALLAVSVLAVVAFNFFTELFTALRNVRLVSALQLLNSVAFAVFGVALLLGWHNGAESVVLAYGGACLLSASVALAYLGKSWRKLPEERVRPTHHELWSKLMPLAGWIWMTSLLINLFDMADRYMIVHYSGPAVGDPLSVVGQYHSSRVVPLLLASVATMLGAMITPHLACDWEAGRRRRVSLRLNLFLKLLCFTLSCGAVLVLAAAPLLFGVAFRGKFDGGLSVLPWTLTYCLWFGMSMVALNYLWCAEKAGWAAVGLVAGLAVDVLLNAMLLPTMGLEGVVWARCVASVVVLLTVLQVARRFGFRTDRGTWIVLAIPAAIASGPVIATVLLVAVALAAATSDWILSDDERRLLAEGGTRYLARVTGRRRERLEDISLSIRPAERE